MEQTSVEYRPIVIDIGAHKILLLLETKIRVDAIALYHFYYGTAIWQKTNSAWCTESYAMNGLGLSKERFRRAKKSLLEVGLIKQARRKKPDGTFGKYYIEVCYYRSRPSLDSLKPTRPESQRVVNPTTNAYSDSNRSAYIVNNTLPDTPNPVVSPRQFPAAGDSSNLSEGRLAPPCKQSTKLLSSYFEILWLRYPRKVAKHLARKAWLKLAPDDHLARTIITAVETQQEDGGILHKSKKGIGFNYIPHLSSYLNNERWEDENEDYTEELLAAGGTVGMDEMTPEEHAAYWADMDTEAAKKGWTRDAKYDIRRNTEKSSPSDK